jgi:hypothetical protein
MQLRGPRVNAVLSRLTKDPDDDTSFLALLACAHLLGGSDDKENQHIVAAGGAVVRLCENLRLTIEGKADWWISELSQAAARLCINDDNKKAMREAGALPLLEAALDLQLGGGSGEKKVRAC